MGLLRKYNHLLLAVFVFLDACILVCSYILAKVFTFGVNSFSVISPGEIFCFLVLIPFLFLFLQKLEYTQKFRSRSLKKMVLTICFYELVVVISFQLISMLPFYSYSDRFIYHFFLCTFLIFMSERVLLKIILSFLRKNGYNCKKYLIVGAGKLGYDFYKMLQRSPELGIKIVGFLDDEMESSKEELADQMIIGKTDQIEVIIKSYELDNVIITLPMTAERKIIEITNCCENNGIRVELIPDYYKIVSKKPSIRDINGYPLIGIRNIPLENVFNRLVKRLFDLTCASFALLFLSPLFLVVSIAIKLTSRGPIFFKQKRTGIHNREFSIYKFRTMYVNEEADVIQASKSDPRKTRIGDFLRRTNIDELPQLFNIIYGEMSIVGPRPHMVKHTEEFYKRYDKYMVRHWVKPGLTGWAQVNGWRGDSDIGIRIKYDIEYIENWTFWFDIKIIFLTIFGKKVRKNAY